MFAEGNQKLSLTRLAIGVAALCALLTVLDFTNEHAPEVLDVPRGVAFAITGPYFPASVGLAIVVSFATVPNLAASSRVLMGVACFSCYVLASRLAPHLVREVGMGSAVAVAGLVGGTLFAMAVHALLFRRPDPAMSLLVGALTIPSVLVFTFERRLFALGYGNTFLLFHIAWYLLFALGLGAAAALRGRAVGSRA